MFLIKMNKRFYLLVLILQISISVFCQTKVAILPVIDKLDQVSYAHELLLSSNITTAIAMTEGYEGYDRIDLSSVMNEQDFQRKGLVSDSEIHKIGEMTGADFVIIAEAAKLDETHLVATAKIVNVESAKISNSSQSIVNISDINQTAKDCQALTNQLLGTVKHSVSNTDATKTNVSSSQSSVREGFVDMGLSVKWAECNIGASSPEQYGNYYAWGETSTKSVYNDGSYSYLNNPSVLPLSRDIANVKLGGSCRMPTDEEWKELMEKCDWTWMQYKGVYGYRVEADNGNCIFLPAAGFRLSDILNFAGSRGGYWSSSLSTSGSDDACELFFYSGGHDRGYYDRYSGRSVRSVCP